MSDATPTLQEVQHWMRARIRPEMTPMSHEPELHLQRGTPGVERLAIYAGGYLARMRAALAEMYPAVEHLLGRSAFDALAQAYAARYPSRDYNLSLAGRHLPALLREDARAASLPFLPDLAQLEWLVSRAFHAFEQPPLEATAFAGMYGTLPPEAWAGLRLRFQPSVGVIASAWPVLDLWQVRTQPRETIDVVVQGRPQRVLVHRHALTVRCRLLEAPEHDTLRRLLDGQTLGDVCEVLAAGDAGAPDVGAWFSAWMRHGLLVACA